MRARSTGADIVMFPELALCGYPPEDLLFCRNSFETIAGRWKCWPRDAGGCWGPVGFADPINGKVGNAAALLGNGTVLDVYHKIELPNYSVFDEQRYFQPGSRCSIFEISGVRVSVTVCEDIWVEGSVTEACAIKNDAQITLNISGSPFYAGKLAVRRSIVKRFARATNTLVCYTNLVGGQDELVFDGGSMVVDSNGELLGCAKLFKEDLFVADINMDGLTTKGPLWDVCGQPNPLKFEAAKGRPYLRPSICPDWPN